MLSSAPIAVNWSSSLIRRVCMYLARLESGALTKSEKMNIVR